MINLGPYSGKNCLMSVFSQLYLTVFWKVWPYLLCLLRGVVFTGYIHKKEAPCRQMFG